MSKAFTPNDPPPQDADDDEEEEARPAGFKNYITPEGFRRIQAELHDLKSRVRPHFTDIVAWAASNGDRSENADYQYGKRKLREIDRRMRYLGKALDTSEIVEYTKNTSGQVFFGATVTIRDEDDSLKTYTIVGVNEVDFERGYISWISPIANALFKSREGDYVQFRSPKGLREIEVVSISYAPHPEPPPKPDPLERA